MTRLRFLIDEEEEKKEKFGWEQGTRGIGELPSWEDKFQKAYKDMAIKMGLSLDPDDPKHFYDYRALYKETGKLEPDETGHFPSKYKLEGHPRMIINDINTKTDKPVSTRLKFTGDLSAATAGISPIKAKADISLAKPKEEPKSFWDISKDEKLMELQKINFESMQLWLKELKESKDKWAFLKGKGQSPELTELRKQYNKLAPYMYKKSEQWIQATTLSAYGVGLASELIPLVAKATPEMLRKILYKTKIKDIGGKELHTALYNVAKGTDTSKQREIYEEFIRAKDIGVPFIERLKGVKIPTVEPRFAFGAKLYAGLPADEIAKSIVEVGKVTAEMVKGLDPVKVSQVTQQLLNINPALASEFLKAVEKPEIKPEEETISGIPKKDEELLKKIDQGLEYDLKAEIEEGVNINNVAKILKKSEEKILKTKVKVLKIDIEEKDKIGLFGEKKTARWIEDFKKAFGRSPTDRELKEIATEQLKEGYEEIGGKVKPNIKFTYLEKALKEIEKSKKPAEKTLEMFEKKEEIPKAEPKEPWQMTKKEYLGDTIYIESAKNEHIQSVVGALREGKSVPEKVLKDYPELKAEPKPPVEPTKPVEEVLKKVEEPVAKEVIPKAGVKEPTKIEISEKQIIPKTIAEAKEILKVDPKKPLVSKDMLAKKMVEKKVSIEDIEAVKGLKIDVKKPKDIIIALRDINAVKKVAVKEPTPKVIPKEPITEQKAEVAPVAEKAISEAPEIELASPAQINKSYSIANSKAMISEEGKLKPQFRKIAEIFTGVKYIEKMTLEQAEMFIDQLDRLPDPKYKAGKLVAPSIPRTMKLTTLDFFKKVYGEPTLVWLLTDQTYYATKLGIKPLVEPFEKGKQEFDLEFRQSSNLVDRMVNKLNTIAKTSMGDRIRSKVKNVPTKAESNMAELVNKHEATPPGLKPKEEDVFKYFRNLGKDIWRRENEVREKVDLPPIKYKQAYFRHTADVMAKEMLEGKYPFPQGIKYWGEKMVGKKIFNPMEFHRKLSDDLIDLWSKDIRAVTKSMLWSGLKEIYLAQPAKFLNEQLNAISKDLPEYRNLSPRDQAAYDQTRVIPSSTKKWLIDYVNQVLKGQETELDASLNRIVTKSGLKGIFDKVLSPFGRSIGRKPITNIFMLSGRAVISGVMGWVPRQIMRNSFQPVQNSALYGIKATIKAYLPASVDKNLKELMSESLFLKSYTGYEELPTNLMAKLEKVWLGPYGIVAVNNAKLGMKAAYWNTIELIRNPNFKKHGWADPQRTKDTLKGFLYTSEKEKLLREMEFGASATQYQYIPMGMPGVFRYKALVPLTRLQSWWMNYFTKFLREAKYRALNGRPSWAGEDGPTLPWSRRVNFLKYLVIGGAILTALGYKKSFMLGVAPTYLSPAGQLALGIYNYAVADEDWKKEKALRQIYYSWKAFIPGSLAWRDFLAVWKGEKELNEILFYGKKEEKKPPPLKITIPKGGKLEFIEPKIDIKSTKLKFNF